MRASSVTLLVCLAASFGAADVGAQRGERREPERLTPGVSVLLDARLSLVRGRRIALVTDAGARDERGTRVDALLRTDRRARAARIVVVGTWTPDALPGAARGTFGSGTAADSVRLARIAFAMDSLAREAQLLVIDVVDEGVRTRAAPWIILAALRAAARLRVPVVLLDRPNPLTGEHAEGPAADSSSGASDALYGLPSRHGMTAGEVARWFNAVGAIGASLDVVPVRGWRRSEWPAERGLPARRTDGEVVSAEQLAILGALAPLAGTNLFVAEGPGRASARIGAPWLDARAVADILNDRLMAGVRFRSGRDDFAEPIGTSHEVPCVYVDVTDRDRASGLRVLASLLGAIQRLHADALRFDAPAFDRLAGSDAVRRAVLSNDDPDTMADRQLAPVVDFRRRARSVLLYR